MTKIRFFYSLNDIPNITHYTLISKDSTVQQCLKVICKNQKQLYSVLNYEGSEMNLDDKIVNYLKGCPKYIFLAYHFTKNIEIVITQSSTNIKAIHENILNFLEDDENSLGLEYVYKNSKIQENKHELKLFLYSISKIAKNHHHVLNFYSKIDQLLNYVKDPIKMYFTNSEIFKIFKGNKRILLFLIEEQIIQLDEKIVKKFITNEYLIKNYHQYFSPEIKRFINESWFPKYEITVYSKKNTFVNEIIEEISEVFYDKRKIGENDNYICSLIQNDEVRDFIIYVNKNNYSLESKIPSSIFETNSLLIKNNPSLIEYAAFYGSIQIFNYLRMNNVELNPSLWIYAIHSKNGELIHLLEECQIVKNNESFKEYFKESIKCHHNSIAEYIQNNYLSNIKINLFDNFVQILKYYNLSLITNESIASSFYELLIYDYYLFVEILFKEAYIGINCQIIQIQIINNIQISFFWKMF